MAKETVQWFIGMSSLKRVLFIKMKHPHPFYVKQNQLQCYCYSLHKLDFAVAATLMLTKRKIKGNHFGHFCVYSTPAVFNDEFV